MSGIRKVRYNPKDVRHVIRRLGDTYTLVSIAEVLRVPPSYVSRWCVMYATGDLPSPKHQVAIFNLAATPRMLRRLTRARNTLHAWPTGKWTAVELSY